MSTTLTAERSPNVNSVWHEEFLTQVVPSLQSQARFRFRGLPLVEREEALAEATATAMISFLRLRKVGKDPLPFTRRLAWIAISRVKLGRTASVPDNSEDVCSRLAKNQRGFALHSLDGASQSLRNGWRALVVEDRRSTPAETAILRLDFAAWLGRMPDRRREIAETLAQGYCTSEVARRFRITAGRVSQMREEFRKSWIGFRGEEAVPSSCGHLRSSGPSRPLA